MGKGIDRITEIVATANKTIKTGAKVVENATTIWDDIGEILTKSRELTQSAEEKYKKFIEEFGKDDIGDKIVATLQAQKDITAIVKEVSEIKDKVLDIYNLTKEIKEQVKEILENLKFVIAELKKWKEIKKEIEQQLVEAKLEVLKAISTCKKLAAKKFEEAKGDLDGLIKTIGEMDLATMDKKGKKLILREFKKVMNDYDWWTSGGEEQVKDLKKSIEDSVTDDLERVLDSAISYVEQSEAWQHVEKLVTEITSLQKTLDAIFNKAELEETAGESLTRKLRSLGEDLIVSAGSTASSFLGELIEPAGPAFELVGKFLEAYKLADGVISAVKKFPEGLDKYLPKEFNKDFITWKKELFDYSVDIPIASLGWISLTAGVGISSEVEFTLKGKITFYNTFKPEELRVLDGSLTATGKISLTGTVSLGVNLVQIIEAKASAELTAAAMVKDATAKLNILRKLSAEAKNGALDLSASTTLAFEIKGALSFSVGLTSALRTVIKWFTSKDPIAKWTLGEVELFTAETTKSFSTQIKFAKFEFDFTETKKLLQNISTYRLSPVGRKNIESSLSTKLGKRDQWEEYAYGAKLTEEELQEIRDEYGVVSVGV